MLELVAWVTGGALFGASLFLGFRLSEEIDNEK